MHSGLPRILTLSIALVAFSAATALAAPRASAGPRPSPGLAPLAVDDPVKSGRDALDHWPAYPWYDSDDDDVAVVAPPSRRKISFGPGENWSFIAWMIVAVVLALVLYGVVYALMNSSWGRTAPYATAAKSTTDVDRVESLPFQVRDPHADLLAEARRHYQQGNFGEAVIYLYSYLLVRLDREQVIRLAKGKTNRQYLREVGPRRSLADILQQTMDAFEDVFFGRHELDRTRFETCWSRVDEFQRHLEKAPA